MHTCAKCKRPAVSLEEIDAGCPCGSKIFTFDRQAAGAVADTSSAQVQTQLEEAPLPPAADGEGGSQGAEAIAGEGGAPESYHARLTFTDDDIENIKVLTQGVFLLDVNAISRNPVVLKDEDDIYYVKLPLEQKRHIGAQEGNWKK
jgi:predicted  nucleic acid-binding Zn-ribbon protein